MKTVTFFLLGFAIFLIAGCEYEKPITKQAEVQFTVGIESFDEPSTADLPDNITIDLTLETGNGQSELKNIAFSKAGDNYISQPVEILPGEYEIKEFSIPDGNITAVPGLVDAFRVFQGRTPVFIGGVAAKLMRGQPLLIAVYVEENGKKRLTDAIATFYTSESEFFKSYQLAARKNHIAFTGAVDEYYELLIEKEGYWSSTIYFAYNELEKKRIEVTLLDSTPEPGPAITFQPSATVFYMQLQFKGTGSVVLDWRNGTKETIDFNVDPENEAGTAFFSREMGYVLSIPPARITGDVDLLKGLYFEAAADGLNVRFATGLELLTLTEGNIDTLDLSANIQLTSLHLTGMYIIGEFIMPPQHHISTLLLSKGSVDSFPSESQLNYIVDNIYTNATSRNIFSGSITLSGIIVPEQSANKLLELQNDYGWSVAY